MCVRRTLRQIGHPFGDLKCNNLALSLEASVGKVYRRSDGVTESTNAY